ncbi:trypsin-like serine protease [Streptacidiphilus sp. PB12-B1b]|uniref:trypsin-like serine peptidase n=1 Tax=Streptacidiphilus sp. PB12-B1b TaxID=2705012 RepID=UPI0015F87F37|nr:trypsin-like serine protease [Streptacidiphilus sp. PB12-B1b]QMU76977.1 trypsin-like serine protease [Streptacidiphilus sp. PB12-B1b]
MRERHDRRRGRGSAARRAGAAAALAALALGGCGSPGGSGTAAAGSPPPAGAVSVAVSTSPRSWSTERFQKALSKHGGTSRTAKATVGNARVGALFARSADGDHFCTASVVHSAAKDLLVTAAHCVHGGKGGSYGSDLVFVPAYRDGDASEGQWPVTRIVVDQRWISSSDPDLDVAFVTVGEVGGRNIEDVLGGNTLGIDKGFGKVVQITGYPATAVSPISCFNRTTQQSQYQMRIACTGFPGGTSGSPWLASFDRATRTGTVIGVIGGYQQGGDTADVSYSPYFDADVQSLYDQAAGASG